MTTTDAFHAKVSFILSLGFWIPLFNIGLTLAAVWIGARAIKRIQDHPKQFGGFGYALAGLIIGLSGFVGTLIFMAVYLYARITGGTLPF
ncbi:MAG: hypothetical protein H6502_02190 [Candidatus Woesearchaeota archaeon]|nr:MAG: hypothetical protein H6502_02190 [Candidatus Woesearchaeota archaeon]